jgi:hypothetical protein
MCGASELSILWRRYLRSAVQITKVLFKIDDANGDHIRQSVLQYDSICFETSLYFETLPAAS